MIIVFEMVINCVDNGGGGGGCDDNEKDNSISPHIFLFYLYFYNYLVNY